MNDGLSRCLFLAQLGSTMYMVGLIWLVQVVHYPLFERVGSSEFLTYQRSHTSLITWVVAAPMLIEGVTAFSLFWFRPQGISTVGIWLGIALLVAIWLSTAMLQMPCHDALLKGFDPVVFQRLVASNWIRTLCWSLRGLLVLSMAWRAFP